MINEQEHMHKCTSDFYNLYDMCNSSKEKEYKTYTKKDLKNKDQRFQVQDSKFCNTFQR